MAMTLLTIACARCAGLNHGADRHCAGCGLPLGSAAPDAVAGFDAIEPHEAPGPSDADSSQWITSFARSAGYEAAPTARGWRLVVPLGSDRRQAVYVGPAGTDSEGRAILSLVSVCGPANERDCRRLLKLNARMVDGLFAVRVLRGEEYFVVIENLPIERLPVLDPAGLVRRVAETADSLEDRLSRGGDVY